MCKHDSTTVVSIYLEDFGVDIPIHQCDLCGATLPALEVAEDVAPLALDERAFDFWLRGVVKASFKDVPDIAEVTSV